jgi:hypothetical protein
MRSYGGGGGDFRHDTNSRLNRSAFCPHEGWVHASIFGRRRIRYRRVRLNIQLHIGQLHTPSRPRRDRCDHFSHFLHLSLECVQFRAQRSRLRARR